MDEMHSDDWYIKRDGFCWEFGTSRVRRTVAFENDRLLLKKLKNPVSGVNFASPGTDSEEFAFSTGEENHPGGASGGWKFIGATDEVQKQGERQLEITLERNGLQVTKSYMIYPGSSIIREWVTFKNTGEKSVQIVEPSFLNFSPKAGDLPSVDFLWMTGGANFPGSAVVCGAGYLKFL